MTYNEWVQTANARINKGERQGQAFMNALFEAKPHLYREVTGTDLDPFYNDSILGRFFAYVAVSWSI